MTLLSCPWAWKLSQKVPVDTEFFVWWPCCDQRQHERETVYLKYRVNINRLILSAYFSDKFVTSRNTLISIFIDWKLQIPHMFGHSWNSLRALYNFEIKIQFFFCPFLFPLEGMYLTFFALPGPLVFFITLAINYFYLSWEHSNFPNCFLNSLFLSTCIQWRLLLLAMIHL